MLSELMLTYIFICQINDTFLTFHFIIFIESMKRWPLLRISSCILSWCWWHFLTSANQIVWLVMRQVKGHHPTLPPKCFSTTMGDILIDGHQISEAKETKFIGVIFDNNLKWSAHIQYINRKNSNGIGVMVKARKIFEQNTLLSLHNSLKLLYFNYCIRVWGKLTILISSCW